MKLIKKNSSHLTCHSKTKKKRGEKRGEKSPVKCLNFEFQMPKIDNFDDNSRRTALYPMSLINYCPDRDMKSEERRKKKERQNAVK